MKTQLQLKLFGVPQFIYQGLPITNFRTNKARALLIYLAVTRHPHSRDALAHLLWADRPATSRSNLRKALSNLRELEGISLVEEGRHLVSLDLNHCWSDVAEFEQQACELGVPLSAKSQTDFQSAAHLYCDDFLVGFNISLSHEFEEWVLSKQARLREQMVDLLRQLAKVQAQHAERPQAIATLRRLLHFEPWQEEVHRQLIELLALSGDRAAALAQYNQCCKVLADELDVKPNPATVALMTGIRDGGYEQINVQLSRRSIQPTASHSEILSRSNLPVVPTPLIGRKQELAELATLLDDTDIRLITILGQGGIGKTRLALAVASNHLPQFEDGTYWVALSPVTEPEKIAMTICKAIGISCNDDKQSQEQLCNYLRPKQVMLLLDNFEHLIEGSNLLANILSVASRVTILITSRERLNLQGEWLFEVQGLELPNNETAQKQPIENYSAIALFLERARQVRPEFIVNDDDMAAVLRICKLMCGVPLALELAAALTRVLSYSELVKELSNGLQILHSTQRDKPDRHHSLYAVFEHSWQLMSPVEQSTFSQLSIFRSSFTREAAIQVAGASLPLLSAFVDKSLMRVSPQGEYEIHELIRQFAAEKLHASGEAETTRSRHEAYFIALAEEELYQLRGQIYHPNFFGNETTNNHSTTGGQSIQESTLHRTLPLHKAIRILMISPESPQHVLGGLGRHVSGLIEGFDSIAEEGCPLLIDLLVPYFRPGEMIESINSVTTIFQVRLPSVADNPYDSIIAGNHLLVEYANTLIEQHRYSLIHIQDSSVSQTGMILKNRWGLPMVTTVHETARGRYQRKPPSKITQTESFEREMCNNSEQIIAASEFMKQEVHRILDVSRDKICVISNGIEQNSAINYSFEDLASMRKKYAPTDQKLLFFVGHTAYEKGLLTLICAMPLILENHPNTLLLIASKHGDKLRPLAYEMNIEEAVVFLGYISDHDRDALFQVVDAAIIPSLYEPFGIVALEAMALGCSVIASNVGGLAEIISHEKTGLLVAPNDPSDIANAVSQLFADPVAAEKWRDNARREIRTKYRWDNIASQTAAVYRAMQEPLSGVSLYAEAIELQPENPFQPVPNE